MCGVPLFRRNTLIRRLQKEGLLGDFLGFCESCTNKKLSLVCDSSFSQDGCVLMCSNKTCNKKVIIRKLSWFKVSHLLLEQVFKSTYHWVYNTPNEVISRKLRVEIDHRDRQ